MVFKFATPMLRMPTCSPDGVRTWNAANFGLSPSMQPWFLLIKLSSKTRTTPILLSFTNLRTRKISKTRQEWVVESSPTSSTTKMNLSFHVGLLLPSLSILDVSFWFCFWLRYATTYVCIPDDFLPRPRPWADIRLISRINGLRGEVSMSSSKREGCSGCWFPGETRVSLINDQKNKEFWGLLAMEKTRDGMSGLYYCEISCWNKET